MRTPLNMWLHRDKEEIMAFYHTCPICGSNLDPGEICDCEREKDNREKVFADAIRPGKRGQYRIDFDRLERGYREKAVM